MSQLLDKVKLNELGKANQTVNAIFQDCADRSKLRTETNISSYPVRLAGKGFKFAKDDYRKAWKELQEIGAGVVIYGRKGNPDRFKWNYSLKDVGIAGLHPEKLESLTPVQETALPKKKRSFDRAEFMRRMWVEGRIKGRVRRGRPRKQVDVHELINEITKQLEILKKSI